MMKNGCGFSNISFTFSLHNFLNYGKITFKNKNSVPFLYWNNIPVRVNVKEHTTHKRWPRYQYQKLLNYYDYLFFVCQRESRLAWQRLSSVIIFSWWFFSFLHQSNLLHRNQSRWHFCYSLLTKFWDRDITSNANKLKANIKTIFLLTHF